MPILNEDYFRYLPISDRDVQWDLYVSGTGFSHVPAQSPYPRSVHPTTYHFAWSNGRVLPEFQVLYITRGEGEFESEIAGKLKITAGNAILLFPGVWHRYRPTFEIGWDEHWISFNGGYAQRLVERGFLSPEKPILRTGMDDNILEPYRRVLAKVRAEPPGYQQIIAAHTMEIIAASLAAERNAQIPDRFNVIVRDAKRLLEERTEEVIDMPEVAASFHTSYAHFRRVFKKQTGLSPYQYHLQLRIHRARELLHGTTLSVKQISARLNFESPYHFSKIFKKKSGLSPTEWRRGGLSGNGHDEVAEENDAASEE